MVASLFRVGIGFALSVGLGIPSGLLLGQFLGVRTAFLPLINFLRNLSPLAWIPLAILWYGIGDKPAVYLIFMATFPPMALTTMAAVTTIPDVHFRVGRDYGFHGLSMLTHVTLPAIMPQVITAIRVTAGIAWVVVVAAEMVGCQDGLGYAIYDARSSLRTDTVILYMIVIGMLGICIDRLLTQFSRLPNVRWGYER
jgi:NitT/TauT family transport system permease protein